MSFGVRPPFHNPRLDWSNSLTAGLRHAWITASLVGDETAWPNHSNVMMRDLVKGHNIVDITSGPGEYIPPVKLGTIGYGIYFSTNANNYCFRTPTNTMTYYGTGYTGPVTVVAWVHLTNTWNDYSTIYSRYKAMSTNGFAVYLYNATDRELSVGISYGTSSGYAEGHSGANSLQNHINKDVLLGWSAKFGSEHKAYINGKGSTPTWFSLNGTYALNDTEPVTLRGEEVGNGQWAEEFGTDGKSAIYTVLYWDRVLSPAEHMMLYDPQTRFSFIEPQAPPKFWSIPYFIVSNSASSSKSAYTSGTSGGTSTSSSKSAFLAGQTPYALRPDGDITDGAWLTQASGTDLYTAIDEPSWIDTDYVWHEQAVADSSFEVSLSNPGVTPGAGNHIIRWRAARIANNRTVTVKCELVQNTTVIATSTQQLTSSAQTFEYTLTSGEVSSITDYNDLRLRFTITTIT